MINFLVFFLTQQRAEIHNVKQNRLGPEEIKSFTTYGICGFLMTCSNK